MNISHLSSVKSRSVAPVASPVTEEELNNLGKIILSNLTDDDLISLVRVDKYWHRFVINIVKLRQSKIIEIFFKCCQKEFISQCVQIPLCGFKVGYYLFLKDLSKKEVESLFNEEERCVFFEKVILKLSDLYEKKLEGYDLKIYVGIIENLVKMGLYEKVKEMLRPQTLGIGLRSSKIEELASSCGEEPVISESRLDDLKPIPQTPYARPIYIGILIAILRDVCKMLINNDRSLGAFFDVADYEDEIFISIAALDPNKRNKACRMMAEEMVEKGNYDEALNFANLTLGAIERGKNISMIAEKLMEKGERVKATTIANCIGDPRVKCDCFMKMRTILDEKVLLWGLRAIDVDNKINLEFYALQNSNEEVQ